MAGITFQHIMLICLIGTTILPTSNAFILEMLGFGASGIVKGSIAAWLQSAGAIGSGCFLSALGFGASGIVKGSIAAWLQSAGATGGGYILSALGFTTSGIAKGSFAAALQSFGVTGLMGTLGTGAGIVGGALTTGAAGAAYYFNQLNSLYYNGTLTPEST
ncbi:unnamed protein product [Orchesella dallaii]|uniref:Uncharacterized protein n=1 Tax=Orchesella dallaii TaxID=48710 RepID=A0ABP1S3C2_9HEXA